MCGRFANAESIPTQAARFRATPTPPDIADRWQPSWNAAPTHELPVILQDGRGRRLGLMRWGWKPDFMQGKLLVNARGEEALGKKTFTEAIRRRRCIVPATAFYEWLESSKQPYAFARSDRSLFGIAGLWETREVDGHRAGVFILLTVPANTVVRPVHHRMVAILSPGDEDRWLGDIDNDGISACMRPAPDDHVHSWPVSRRVSRVANNDRTLLDANAPSNPA